MHIDERMVSARACETSQMTKKMNMSDSVDSFLEATLSLLTICVGRREVEKLLRIIRNTTFGVVKCNENIYKV